MIKNRLIVYIPCFNEEKNISKLIQSWDIAIKNTKDVFILFINNGSDDKTLNKLQSNKLLLNNQYMDYHDINRNKGYGYGILEGITNYDSEHICWTHADLQFSAQDVVKLINKYLENNNKNQVLKGQRLDRNVIDTIFTKIMSIIGFFLKGVYISDINAQPKIFSRKFFNSISKWPTDFSIDAHLLYSTKNRNYNIKSYKIKILPRQHEEAKGGGSLGGKFKLSINTLKYFLGFYKKY
jgi:glycosyltransferase involved in cell wall biosynthesis